MKVLMSDEETLLFLQRFRRLKISRADLCGDISTDGRAAIKTG